MGHYNINIPKKTENIERIFYNMLLIKLSIFMEKFSSIIRTFQWQPDVFRVEKVLFFYPCKEFLPFRTFEKLSEDIRTRNIAL